jgi:hypothetical protein
VAASHPTRTVEEAEREAKPPGRRGKRA